MSTEKPSKSARKREYLALQALGEQLIELSPQQLGELPLDERLLDAVVDAQGMKAHGALRRQKQYIGKLMRETDPEPIRAGIERFTRSDRHAKALFRDAEAWRDRIAAEGSPALDAFAGTTGTENDTLRELVSDLGSTTDRRARKLVLRKVFSEVHQALTAAVQNGAAKR